MANGGLFYFSKSHEWVSKNSGSKYRMGISDFAQSELGDVVYISLPEQGKTFIKGDKIGEIESVKSVSEIYAPVDMKVISVNSRLHDAPELVNKEPYGEGFMVEAEVLNDGDINGLMDKQAYESFTASLHE